MKKLNEIQEEAKSILVQLKKATRDYDNLQILLDKIHDNLYDILDALSEIIRTFADDEDSQEYLSNKVKPLYDILDFLQNIDYPEDLNCYSDDLKVLENKLEED